MIRAKKFHENDFSAFSAEYTMTSYIKQKEIKREQIISITHSEYVLYNRTYTTVMLVWEDALE